MRASFKMVCDKNRRSNVASLNIKFRLFAGLRTFCEQGHGRGEFKMFFRHSDLRTLQHLICDPY